VPLATA